MTEPNAIEGASKRLALALDGLAAAVERRRNADAGEATLAAQLHALGSDRTKLAAELDEALGGDRLVRRVQADETSSPAPGSGWPAMRTSCDQ